MSTLLTTNLKNPSSGSNNIVLSSDGNITLGTAKVTAITDSAGNNSSTPEAIANGTCKAWVNFNGTGTVAIRASYNVSSITDNGTGDYTVNFTTAMVDANYSTVLSSTVTAGFAQAIYGNIAANRTGLAVQAPTATNIRASFIVPSTGTAYDVEYISVAVFR